MSTPTLAPSEAPPELPTAHSSTAGACAVPELSGYVFEPLRQDGEFLLSRGQLWHHIEGSPAAILVLAPVAEYPTPASLRRLEHECSLQAELDPAWAVRPLALAQHQSRTVLVLEHPGGEPLDQLLGTPLEFGLFLRVAVGLAAALGQLHTRGLIHKDLKPAHILVNVETCQVWLTGFGLASSLPRERQAPDPPDVIAGTLAYMAPEQTGRMNRSIDARSDLYALGVTLYELLTGSLPFMASDPMEWVHSHIARQPVPPGERARDVPPIVSALVMKLLAKTAEDRYQTAAGVEHDLRRCLVEWEARGAIDVLFLGERDVPDRLLIAEKLYGREREIDTLLAAFERVVKSGTPELVLISGYSGIGKSSIVHELHKVLVPPRGLFASGKFDQYQRDIPYATVVQAVQSLIRPLLGKSEAELVPWREGLREALGPNGRLMTDLVPELKLLVGEQPPVPELPPQDAHRRFQLVVRRFIGVFARREHPLVLFLDDLQWLDAATLDVLTELVTQPDVHHLLVIGAYRDNEVDAAHPLMHRLETIRQAEASVQEIVLAPLTPDDLGRLLAEALRCEPETVGPLAQLVHTKTGGNPFFVLQFITALADEGLLSFAHENARWSWDLERIHTKGYTDNVVDLMIGKLTRLPADTQGALQQLACLGSAAQVSTLSLVCGTAEAQVHAELFEAVRAELVERQGGSYKFIHDRVQEAAYALIPADSRAQAHLGIGRLLAAHTPTEQQEKAIFEIVNQLNRGVALITAREEREQLAELNLLAGTRAKQATAYASGLTYLTAGAAVLAEDCWERRHELPFALELNRAECEFLTGELTAAEERLTALATRAATTVEHATVACLRMDVCTTLGQSGRAIAVGLDYLRRVGIDWSPHPTDEDVRHEYERIWSQLGGHAIEELIDLSLMNDATSLASLDVLSKLAPPALYTDLNLFSLTLCRAVNLSLERGNCDGSCYAYGMLGMVAGARFGDYQAAYRFGRLGYDLVERHGFKRFQARTYMVFGSHIMPWTKHVLAGRDLLRRAFEAANTLGDLTFAAYICHHLNDNMLAAGDPLVEVQRAAENGLAFARKIRYGRVSDIITVQLALIRTLRGLTPTFGRFDDEQFDELRIERRFSENPDLALYECWYWIRKLQARFLAGDHPAAIEASSQAQRLLWRSPSHFATAEYHFYSALSRAASWDAASPDQRPQHVEALAAHHRQLAVWVEHGPENFENRAALVGAEIARLEGRELDAERLYERAIRSAHEQKFIHHEALANELAARFYAARGFEKIASAYVRDARYYYQRWGAEGKVRQLDELYPHLRQEPAPQGPTTTIGVALEQLDLATVVKMSQAVSGELVLAQLIDVLLRTALEHAGAERGLLILPHGDALRIEAEATTTWERVEVRLRHAGVTPGELPETVLHYVLRTQQRVVLDDAAAEHQFAADGYLRQTQARSLLCLPLVRQAKLIGVLYLENRLTPHVFTPARIAVLQLLASQAAISLENARLYTDLQHENHERQRAEEAVRASEQSFRLIVDGIAGLVAIMTADGEVEAVNRQLLEYFGKTLAELQGWATSDPIHPDDLPHQLAAWRHSVETGQPYDVDHRLRRADGVYRWFHARGLSLRDDEGRIVRWYVLLMDIDDRKQAEEKLRRSEEYLLEAQRLSHTGSWARDVTSGTVTSSPEALRIFGITPEEAPSTLKVWVNRMHPEDRKRIQELFTRCEIEKTDYEADYRIVFPDGTIKHHHAIAHPVVNESGHLVEMVGTAMDVTEQWQARVALEKAFEEIHRLKDRLQDENVALREELDRTSMFEEIVGASPALQAVLARVAKVAPTDSTVLITGETGTGKELIARAIHKGSARAARAFVSVNCAAIPPSLIAAELFGHEKGAFTGAVQRRLGRFELAEGGTLFLDEIGELPIETQVALLRVLQEHEFERVGGTRMLRADVRVIAATNRDLPAAVAAGTFRSDLFYRINVFPLALPPLRARPEDIPLLIEYFLDRYASKAGKKIWSINKKTLELLQAYRWPGNIRELQNVIERSVIVCETETFSVDASWLAQESESEERARQALGGKLEAQEKDMIEAALAETRGRVAGPSGAAAKLGMPSTTLESKIKSLKIDKYRFKSTRHFKTDQPLTSTPHKKI